MDLEIKDKKRGDEKRGDQIYPVPFHCTFSIDFLAIIFIARILNTVVQTVCMCV